MDPARIYAPKDTSWTLTQMVAFPLGISVRRISSKDRTCVTFRQHTDRFRQDRDPQNRAGFRQLRSDAKLPTHPYSALCH
jgi:hypothetical protein